MTPITPITPMTPETPVTPVTPVAPVTPVTKKKIPKSKKPLLIVASTILLLLLIFIIYQALTKQPIYADWWENEVITISYEYHDLKGYHHQGIIDDPDQVQEFGNILMSIANRNPTRALSSGERAGAVTYYLEVSHNQKTVIYSVQGAFLAVGKSTLSIPTIYKLTDSETSEIINFFSEYTSK